VRTNAGFLVRCLKHARFVEGDVDTGFIAAEIDALTPVDVPVEIEAAALADLAHRWEQQDDGATYRDIWSQSGAHGLRLNAKPRAEYRLQVNGKTVAGDVSRPNLGAGGWLEFMNWRVVVGDQVRNVIHYHTGLEVGGARISRASHQAVLFLAGQAFEMKACAFATAAAGPVSDGALRAPMPGKIVATPVKPGDAVTKGQPIVVLEAMKMEHALVAPFDGEVGEVGVSVGDQVAADTVLAVITARET